MAAVSVLVAAVAACNSSGGGDTAATPPPAPPVTTPPPPQVANPSTEACPVCHAPGRIADLNAVHRISGPFDPATGQGGLTDPTISNIVVTVTGRPVVTFKAADSDGSALTGLTTTNLRFLMGQLTPGANGSPSTWNRLAYESGATVTAGLVDNGGGNYTYTFATDVTQDAAYDASKTTRLGIQMYRISGVNAYNGILDFVPNGAAVTVQRLIVDIKSCNECHGRIAMHGGGRVDTRICVLCHNRNVFSADVAANGSFEGEFPFMIHRIHSSGKFEVFHDGVDYGNLSFPPENGGRTCRKCHNGDADASTPQGNNWRQVPNRLACSGCHSEVNFATGANHVGGSQTDDSVCALCHTNSVTGDGIAPVEYVHRDVIKSTNNPNVPKGVDNISYQVSAARINGANLEIDFKILRETVGTGTGAIVELDVNNLPSDLTTANNRPGWIFAFAGSQDGIASPADFNNSGETIGNAINGRLTDGVTTFSGGVNTTTMANPFPAGAKMRTVALQSYFAQTVSGGNVARHAAAAVKTVTGDTKRRRVIDPAKCTDGCHEWLELHGGSRTLTASTGTDEPPVCTMCHNPNKSSGGRELNPATASAQVKAVYGADPLLYPEESMNFRNLVHGIHSSNLRTRQINPEGGVDTNRTGRRSNDFDFVRPRLNGIVYNFSRVQSAANIAAGAASHGVTFPGILNNCLTCHIAGAYELPFQQLATQLPSVDVTQPAASLIDGNNDHTDIANARNSVPNATDLVSSPIAGACRFCHDTEVAKNHMVTNGGSILKPRSDLTGIKY